MEKAKLIITESKKKKLIATLCLEDSNKILPFPQLNRKDSALNGTIVEVKRDKGKLVYVKAGDDVLYSEEKKITSPPRNPGERRPPYNTGLMTPATAPYNFVPLNHQVVASEHQEPLPFNNYHKNANTGYIQLGVTTQTPLYIRDSSTHDDMKAEAEMKERNKKNNTKFKIINSDFYSPGGTLQIPGSSLRGMIRTMVEITSYSRMEFYEKDRKYHFRAFADKSIDLRDEYTRKMKGDDKTNSYSKELKAGYLIKKGLSYGIKPAKPVNTHQFFRVEEDRLVQAGIIRDTMSTMQHGRYKANRRYKMEYKKIKFLPPSDGGVQVEQVFHPNSNVKNGLDGKVACSGWIGGPRNNPRGKYMHWLIGPVDNRILDFHEGVIKNYKNDAKRDKKADLLQYFQRNPNDEVPCFYVESEGKVLSFGHTGFFRLAYKQKLSDLVPAQMQDSKKIDIAGAIFGNESAFPGRVFFEDLKIGPNQMDILSEETVIKVLGGPSPTTFQHYLSQDKSRINLNNGNYHGINHFNSPGAQLRGNKLYWHKTNNPENWEEVEISFPENEFKKILAEFQLKQEDFGDSLEFKNYKCFVNVKELPPEPKRAIFEAVGRYETQHTKIQSINPGKSFSGKIRFENLTDVELGALLFALSLPEGCSHKIGMAKPLGLGSIKITLQLRLSNRPNRYRDLFSEWTVPIEAAEKKEIETKKEKFASYILAAIEPVNQENSSNKALWNLKRMQQLETMLDFDNKPGEVDTAYMDLKEFRKRNILPSPTEVNTGEKS